MLLKEKDPQVFDSDKSSQSDKQLDDSNGLIILSETVDSYEAIEFVEPKSVLSANLIKFLTVLGVSSVIAIVGMNNHLLSSFSSFSPCGITVNDSSK